MSLVWDAKNNFILLHAINSYQQQSFTVDIDWPTIVRRIRLDIFATATELQKQYEHLLETFQLKNDAKSLYTIIKDGYLRSLCQSMEEDRNSTLLAVYRFLRHLREKQIDANDIQQLIDNCNLDSSSDEEKEKKDRLLVTLTRLRDSIDKLPSRYDPIVDDHCEHIIIVESLNDDAHHSSADTPDPEKFSATRRRTQSLTILDEDKTDQSNVGVEWFVPINKRQQRSSSLDSRSPSPTASNELQSTSNSDSQQIQIQSVLGSATVTDEQIVEKKRRHVETKILDDEDLEQISSSGSELSSVGDTNENSSKRQRVS